MEGECLILMSQSWWCMYIDGRLDYFMRVVDVGEIGRCDDGDGGCQEVK